MADSRDAENAVLGRILDLETRLNGLEGRIRLLPDGNQRDDCWAVISELWQFHSLLWESTKPFHNHNTGGLPAFHRLISDTINYIGQQADVLQQLLDEID